MASKPNAGTVAPDAATKRAIQSFVQDQNGSVRKAAKALGLSYDSVLRLMGGAPVRRVTLELVKIKLKEAAAGKKGA